MRAQSLHGDRPILGLKPLWNRLLGGQRLSLAAYVTVTAPTGEAISAGRLSIAP